MKKIDKKTEAKMWVQVEKVINQFGRIRLGFPDYPLDKNTIKTCWNGIYTDIEPPTAYKEALMKLIFFGMKLK